MFGLHGRILYWVDDGILEYSPIPEYTARCAFCEREEDRYRWQIQEKWPQSS